MAQEILSTKDAFHKGRFFLIQPKNEGHRAGIDAMLLAALVDGSNSNEEKLADLGAGAGAASLAVASRTKISVWLFEKSQIMANLAKQSLELDENNGFAKRCKIIQANVELKGQARIDAGFEDNFFDHVIMNPPFNEKGDRATPNALKAEAHAMSDDDLFEKWIKTAAAIAKPKGQLSLIARPSSLDKILNACQGRFGGLEITNVQPRQNQDAIRILVTGIKSSKARLKLKPPIILHDSEPGRNIVGYTTHAESLINGKQLWKRAQ